MKDHAHELLVYKLDHRKFDENATDYLRLPSIRCELADNAKPSGPGMVMNSKDSLSISSCLCSTKLTQNVELLGLLKYHSQPDELPSILARLMRVDGEEVVKFLQDVLDSLFNILMQNSDSDVYDNSVFECLIFIVGLVTDRKYEHFKVMLIFIDQLLISRGKIRQLNVEFVWQCSPSSTCTSRTTSAPRWPTRSCWWC